MDEFLVSLASTTISYKKPIFFLFKPTTFVTVSISAFEFSQDFD